MKRLLLLAAVAAAFPAFGGVFPEYPDLPPQQAVSRALETYPSVLAARSGMQAGDAARERLEAGSHEFTVTTGAARRRVTETGDNQRDWTVGLERSLRLPRKAELDAELGRQGVVMAHNGYGDAMHEAGRKLLAGWFGWQRERAQAAQWRQQVDALTQQRDAVARRVKAGDAASLEDDLAKAALMQAEISSQQASLRADNAAAALGRYFPTLALPAQPVTGEPRPLEGDLEHWLGVGLEHNHELMLARAASKIAQLNAQRADADRIPDPTVGVHYTSERNGGDRITGLSFSIPLPGTARRAIGVEAAAKAEMAAQSEALVLRRLEADISAAYNNARAAYASWERAREAATLMERNADKMTRAYALGEMGLNEVLLARRQAMEASLAATVARLDAAEGRYRLLLDTHQLWPLGEAEPD